MTLPIHAISLHFPTHCFSAKPVPKIASLSFPIFFSLARAPCLVDILESLLLFSSQPYVISPYPRSTLDLTLLVS